jgi:hypothetical protein
MMIVLLYICGDFILSSFYFIIFLFYDNPNMMYGIIGLMVVAVLGARILR